MRMPLGLRSPGLVVLVALAFAHFVIGLLQLEQALCGEFAVVLTEVEGVDVRALSTLETVAERAGVGVDVFPAPTVGVWYRGIMGRGCSGSG